MTARTATLTKANISEDKNKRWMDILVKSFMSSEESGTEQLDDGSTRPVIFVKPLPWRHAKVTKFLGQLSFIIEKGKSKRAKQQTLPRVEGEVSSRPKPQEFPSDFWGYCARE